MAMFPPYLQQPMYGQTFTATPQVPAPTYHTLRTQRKIAFVASVFSKHVLDAGTSEIREVRACNSRLLGANGFEIREVKTQFGPAADRILGAEMLDDASRVAMNEDDLARGITVALSDLDHMYRAQKRGVIARKDVQIWVDASPRKAVRRSAALQRTLSRDSNVWDLLRTRLNASQLNSMVAYSWNRWDLTCLYARMGVLFTPFVITLPGERLVYCLRYPACNAVQSYTMQIQVRPVGWEIQPKPLKNEASPRSQKRRQTQSKTAIDSQAMQSAQRDRHAHGEETHSRYALLPSPPFTRSSSSGTMASDSDYSTDSAPRQSYPLYLQSDQLPITNSERYSQAPRSQGIALNFAYGLTDTLPVEPTATFSELHHHLPQSTISTPPLLQYPRNVSPYQQEHRAVSALGAEGYEISPMRPVHGSQHDIAALQYADRNGHPYVANNYRRQSSPHSAFPTQHMHQNEEWVQDHRAPSVSGSMAATWPHYEQNHVDASFDGYESSNYPQQSGNGFASNVWQF